MLISKCIVFFANTCIGKKPQLRKRFAKPRFLTVFPVTEIIYNCFFAKPYVMK